MGSLARQLNRRREVMRVEDYKACGQWDALLKFCRAHEPHGEMEFQASEEGQYMACILCRESFACGEEFPEPLFDQLIRRFSFSLWLSV